MALAKKVTPPPKKQNIMLPLHNFAILFSTINAKGDCLAINS